MFPQLFGKYVLEREIAAGGMARVYLATLRGAVGFEKRLVVKQIRPELAVDHAFVRRFVEEAKTAVELSHPNIVPVYELGVEQGVYYIAMELCVGVTLSELLVETGKLTPEEGAYVGVEICRALDYAHRRSGIVHRDITPRNVLIDEEGAVRVIDFGIAAPAAGNDRGPSEVFGSPGHMPPEQIAGKPLSPSADVFAVAVLLYEAWTGQPAFRRSTAKASFEALEQPLASIDVKEPALGPLAELLQRGLSREPEARPARAELFARPLRDFLRNVDAGDVARRLGERARSTLRRAPRARDLRPPTAHGAKAPRDSDSGSALNTPQVGSHTFAAREELAEWTRRLDSSSTLRASEPPSAGPRAQSAESPSESPSTRKLPSTPPDIDSASGGVEASVPSRRRVAAKSSGELHDQKLRWTLVAAATVALVGVLLASFFRMSPDAVDQTTVASRGALSGRDHAAAAGGHALPVNAGLEGRADRAGARALESARPASTAVVASAPSEGPRALAMLRANRVFSPSGLASASLPKPKGAALRLTADLPATVSVQGASGVRSFSTPVRALSLPPGEYTIVFRSPTYAAPIVTHLRLEPSTDRSVHVDFREAEPRVSLQ